ncbi:MAG: hypothetical protein ABJI96_15240 [Paracoccaceae bacterium]
MRTFPFATLTTSPVFAPADGAQSVATTQAVAELVTFRLNSGVSDLEFVRAAERSCGFLNDTGGVLRRTLSKDENGLWTDYITWMSMDIAVSTAEVAMQHPDFAPMMSMIDPETVELRHAPILMQMD